MRHIDCPSLSSNLLRGVSVPFSCYISSDKTTRTLELITRKKITTQSQSTRTSTPQTVLAKERSTQKKKYITC